MNEEKKVLSIQYKEKIYIFFRLLTHPIDALNDVKYEKKGSLTIANIILFLFFLVSSRGGRSGRRNPISTVPSFSGR